MKIRNSLYSKPVIGTIDQGTIFNNAYSVDYENSDVYGVIITPRCDIANAKVSTLHYLPIVKYSDWLEVDFFNIIYDIVYKNIFSDLTSKLKRFNVSPELLEVATKEQIITVVNSLKINPKDAKIIIDSYDKYIDTKNITGKSSSEISLFLKNNEKLVKSTLKEIAKFDRKSFYFLEPWNSELNEPIYIVLLREIRSISKIYADHISKGCYINKIDILRYDDIRICKPQEEIFANVESLINPPFMEHLIQTFFHNIGRIGINEYDQTLDTYLFELL